MGKTIPNIDIQYGKETWETTMQKNCINHKCSMSKKKEGGSVCLATEFRNGGKAELLPFHPLDSSSKMKHT